MTKIGNGLGEVQRTGTKSTMGKYDVCRQLLMSICNLKNFAVENICEDNQECFEFLDGEEGALEQNDK